MSALYYYRHIIGDYDRDTKELTLLEHGVYRRLMDAYYGNRGPLLADPANLYRVTSAILPDEQAAVRKIAYLFFDLEKGYLRNAKCDKEIARVLKESEAQSARARKRWGPPEDGVKDAGAYPAADAGSTVGDMPNHVSGTSTASIPAAEGKAETGEAKADSAVLDAGASPPAMPTHMPNQSHSHIEAESKERGGISLEKPAKRFVPPTADQVRDYCNERANGVDANRFVAFYESKGWMVGKNRMKNWQAAVRTWETRQEQERGKRAATEARNEATAQSWADAEV